MSKITPTEKCHARHCTDNADPANINDDGELWCETCWRELCEWCHHGFAEHDIDAAFICQPCYESLASDAYDRAKDRQYD